jgi:hypothetical protein
MKMVYQYLFLISFFGCNEPHQKVDNLIISTNINSESLQEKRDVIHYKEINISGISLGVSKEKIIQKFGKKYKEKKAEGESYDLETKILKYNQSEFYFVKNKFVDFSLEDSLYSFNGVKVGDNFKIIKKIFPNTKPYKLGSKLLIKVQIDDTDSYIIFEFTNNKIVKISSWSDL